MSDPYPPAAHQPYGGPLPEHPQGTMILVLGVLGLVTSITAFIAWYLGSKALKEIRTSGFRYANEQNIVVGRMIGMILSIVSLVAIAGTIIALIVAVAITAGSAR